MERTNIPKKIGTNISTILECEQVTKSYGDLVAVNDVSLGIKEGEIFGLDPTKEPDELHEKIGVQLQTTSIQPNIMATGCIGRLDNRC